MEINGSSKDSGKTLSDRQFMTDESDIIKERLFERIKK